MLTAVPKRLRRQVLGVVDLSGSRGLEVPEGRLTERFEEASLRPPIHRLPLSLSQPSVFSVPLWLDSQRHIADHLTHPLAPAGVLPAASGVLKGVFPP